MWVSATTVLFQNLPNNVSHFPLLHSNIFSFYFSHTISELFPLLHLIFQHYLISIRFLSHFLSPCTCVGYFGGNIESLLMILRPHHLNLITLQDHLVMLKISRSNSNLFFPPGLYYSESRKLENAQCLDWKVQSIHLNRTLNLTGSSFSHLTDPCHDIFFLSTLSWTLICDLYGDHDSWLGEKVTFE